jgi:hypothetical protein
MGDDCNLRPLMCKIMGVIKVSDNSICSWYDSKVTVTSLKDGARNGG